MTTTTDLLRRAAEALRGIPALALGVLPAPADQECQDLAASLLALADQMERAEPVGTVRTCVWNGQGWTVSLIVPIKMRVGDPLYTHPAPEVTRDAERYRWLRDGNATERGEPWAITRYAPGDERNRDGGTCPLAGDELDAAIDAAMQESKP